MLPTSEPASGSVLQNAATFGSSASPKHCGTEDGHGDPGVAPEQLLVRQRQGEPAGVTPAVGEELEAVQADLGGLLDQRPRGLLPGVPLGRGRSYRLRREAVYPVAQVAL